MSASAELVVVDSRHAPADRCVVCGNDIAAGEGITATYRDRALRFKCPGCLNRFQADPERDLADHAGGCCRSNAAPGSPHSEWSCS